MYTWPERKPLRLKQYDYSQDGYYFITICTKNREHYFWEIVDGEMMLNDYGKIVQKCFWDINNHYQNVELDIYVIMPNHLHCIIILKNNTVGNEYFRSESNNRNENIHFLQANISNIIKWFKIWITKEIRNNYKDFTFAWQKSFFDVIIKNDEQLEKSREYILNNPLQWEFDTNNSAKK